MKTGIEKLVSDNQILSNNSNAEDNNLYITECFMMYFESYSTFLIMLISSCLILDFFLFYS